LREEIGFYIKHIVGRELDDEELTKLKDYVGALKILLGLPSLVGAISMF
jgi:hypothetical protein